MLKKKSAIIVTTKCLKFVIAKYITCFSNYIINFKNNNNNKESRG